MACLYANNPMQDADDGIALRLARVAELVQVQGHAAKDAARRRSCRSEHVESLIVVASDAV